MKKGEPYFKRPEIQLVDSKIRYPGLKPLLKSYGLTYKSVYIQFDVMRPEQFTNILSGTINEPKGFLKAVLGALKRLSINATEKELKNPLK